jgi:hypothetical protein
MHPTKIRQKYRNQIHKAALRFKDHEDMSAAHISRWLSRFADEDLELGAKVLERIQYYSGRDIREMVNSLVRMVHQSLHNLPRNKIYFVPVGRVGGGSTVLVRALADNPRISRSRIKHMVELEDIPPSDIDAIVFVDDFSGTGKTLVDWWETVEMMVLPKAATVVVGLLVMNHKARPKIENFAGVLVPVNELGEEYDVLSPYSNFFQQAEKDSLAAYCVKTGCSDQYLRGFGDCGLLVAFKHLCPNNSLPILWHESGGWNYLFRRRGI